MRTSPSVYVCVCVRTRVLVWVRSPVLFVRVCARMNEKSSETRKKRMAALRTLSIMFEREPSASLEWREMDARARFRRRSSHRRPCCYVLGGAWHAHRPYPSGQRHSAPSSAPSSARVWAGWCRRRLSVQLRQRKTIAFECYTVGMKVPSEVVRVHSVRVPESVREDGGRERL
jgi:hypothetical protein